ncbi:hypothetical protein IB276_36160 [Ensifer sp. ENS04]|uniref:hypothetical protein n=1 Tax=Ensifer sp. ENS04 TaxID=2769281 RepID=UPI00177D7306|nr:hypothetical protein [Ensifer sp. ENS04]MBD9544866.1 hypothetical protein [Ensifer sp. ENS04]
MSVLVTSKLGSLKRPVPLTQRKLSGEPYVRFADVETQITEVIQSPVGEWPRIIFRDTRRWKTQTLVYLARQSIAQEQVFGQLLSEILRRASKVLGHLDKVFDPTTLELIDAELAKMLAALIVIEIPTRTSEYLEIDFKGKVKQLAHKVVAAYKAHPAPNQILISSKHGDRPDPLEAIPSDDTPYSLLAAKTDRGLIRRLLKAVTDDRHRKAFILRKMRDWPMYDEDSTVPSVLRHFGLRPEQRRTVQYWIERAEKQMREAYGEEQ